MKKSTVKKILHLIKETGIRLLVFILVFTFLFSGWPAFIPRPQILETQKAHAAGTPGDFAVYYTATAGEFLTNTMYDHDWDTTVATSSSVNLNVDNTQIELKSGHYAVMYNTRYDHFAGTNRSEAQTAIMLNNATSSIGWGQGFMRRSQGTTDVDNVMLMSGGGIIDVASDDDPLKIRSFRTDSNPTATMSREDNATGVSILKLDDTWDYLRLSKTGTQSGPTNSTFIDVTYNRQDEYDTGSFTHSTSSNPGNITLKTKGHYLVFANTYQSVGAVNDRTEVNQRLTLGGSYVEGSYTTVYIRGHQTTGNTQQGASAIGMIIETTADNQILNVEVNRDDGTTALTINEDRFGTYVDRTALTVVKLPDSADYIRLGDSGTDNMNPLAMTAMGWDTEIETLATSSFSHNDSQIGVTVDGDFMFFSALFAEVAGDSRVKWNQGWSKNGGALLQYGQTGRYNRKSGADNTGNWSGVIFKDLTYGDYVEVETIGRSMVGAAVGADYKGVQGVNIYSLFHEATEVSGFGNQIATTSVGSVDTYIGGGFAIDTNRGYRNVESITITASGTVDAQNDLDNIELYYDLDTTAPYNCVGETFTGTSTETQYGSTDTDGFSSANGTSTFTESVQISTTTTMCVYVVLDVGLNASHDDTLDIEIDDPSVDIVMNVGGVGPDTFVEIADVTLIKDSYLTQIHYHWRDDLGTEATAGSLTGDTEDTPFTQVEQEKTIRLRLEVSNEGGAVSDATKYRLEFGTKITSCGLIGSWERVWTVGGAWDPSNSDNLTQGDDTTNISPVTNGGVTDANTTFLTPNGGVRDTSDITDNIVLESSEFVELEYSIEATDEAVDSTVYCFRVTDNGAPLPGYDIYPEATFNVHLQANTTGTQKTNIDIPTSNVHVGGSFVVQDLGAGNTHTVTDVTITETGSVDAQNDLDNIELWYEYDTTTPYDCAGEDYDGGELQFGSTDTDGFSSANGVATFSGVLYASTTQAICLYPVLDVLSSAQNSETIQLQITSPSTDIVATSGDAVRPSDPVAIDGTTTLRDDVLTQIHYHFRNDDGGESTSTAAVAQEDFPILAIAKGVQTRIRLEVSNEGSTSSDPVAYRIEYGEKVTTCGNILTWLDIGAVGDHWDMYDSDNLTNSDDTTDIALGIGGVTNANTTFLTPNGGVRDTTSQTGNLTLTKDDFVEIEYSIVASTTADDGKTYCLRVTDAGTPLAAYDVYPELTISPDVTVSAAGTQKTNIDVPTVDNYVGGMFVIVDETGQRDIDSITISETGSVDAQNDLDNIELWYDLDTSNPYNCVGETYEDGATQYGSTDTDGFSSANGVSIFTESVGISTTTSMCVYVVLDTTGGASNGESLGIQITDPSSEVVTSVGVVVPGVPVAISGSTNLRVAVLSQVHYHFRDDDGSEAGASSLTGGSEDTVYTEMGRGVTTRLRVEVNNSGATTSVPMQYRLEYGEKISDCSSVDSWTDVAAAGGLFDMSNSSNLTEGGNTTDIALGIGGVTNANTTFLTPNGGVRDITSQTGNISLAEDEFVELEYSIMASTTAVFDSTYCFRVTDAGTASFSYSEYPEATITSDVTVSSAGTQEVYVDIPRSDVYVGGMFVLTDDVNSHTIESITITASGTVDAQNDLDNIELYYDLDTTAPYNCVGETFTGTSTETQYGSTDTDGFSSATGTSMFSEDVVIATSSTMCVYVVFDVLSSASNVEVLDIEINNPATDVILKTGTVVPTSAIAISGVTTLRDDVLTQIHYHWRNNLGTEATSGSLTSNVEDTAISNTTKNDIYRLRLEVSNEGSTSSDSVALRVEYSKKITTCANVSSWVDIGAVGGDFDMLNSLNLTDGEDTTNISPSTNGGVTDENTTFITPNSAVKEGSSTVATTTFSETEFMEMEFSITALDAADFAQTYCFRVSDKGTALASYYVYPEMTTRENKDFNVMRGVETISGTSTTLYNGIDYDLQGGSTTAFMRITNSQHTGAGNNTIGSPDDIDNFTAYLLDPENIGTSVTIARPSTATLNTRVAWEVVEYIGPAGGDNEMIVRGQLATTYGASNFSATTSSITVTDGADVVVFITGQGNSNANRTTMPRSLSTAFWHSTSSVAVFTRGASGTATEVSWAVVEFIGTNWKIQRREHNYTTYNVWETETIDTVGSLSRTFIHDQKRTAQNGLDETGHEVYLYSTGTVRFWLQDGVTSPGTHYSVVWVIENTQTGGIPMVVTRSNGTRPNTGTDNETYNAGIGKTLNDLSIASIFINNRSTGNGDYFPRPVLGVRLISTTQYEIWRSDVGQNQAYRTEVVEWPTAERTVSQNYYRFYVDNDALKPTDPWPAGGVDLGENTAITAGDEPPQIGDLVRIRMTLSVSGATLPAGAKTYKLQYGLRISTCSAITDGWNDVAPISSSTASWRGFNGTTTADETNLSGNPPTGGDLLFVISDRAGTYEEENNTKANPFAVSVGEDVEYDWLIQRNAGVDQGAYCFRMVESDGVPVDVYNYYPTIVTAGYNIESLNWRWYEDEGSVTPSVPLEDEVTAPTEIDYENAIKLRLTLDEIGGASGVNQKFRLQYSTNSGFSEDVNYMVEMADCTATSTWCYYDGAGVDNAKIASSTLSDADSCLAGVGDGCGTHNELGTSTSTYIHPPYAAAEYEFTIQHAGAQENVTYYFRAYDVINDEVVSLGSGKNYPSLSTKGATLSFTILGLPSGTTTEDVVTDVTTYATSVPFGNLAIDSDVEAAHRLKVTTNAPNGYQIFMYGRQEFLSSQSEIEPITSTNQSPDDWATACGVSAKSCFGYHSGDDTLEGGSGRFSADDSFAKMATSSEEVAYSSFPVNNDTVDIVYKVRISDDQEAGFYEHGVVYIVVPRF